MPITTPPSTWPSAPIGLRIRPTSCDAATSSTRTTPVSRSILQWVMWVMKVGATHDSSPSRPTHPEPSTSGG